MCATLILAQNGFERGGDGLELQRDMTRWSGKASRSSSGFRFLRN